MHCNMKYPKLLYIFQEYWLTVATLSPSKCHNETCRGVIRHHVVYTLNRGNFISYRLKYFQLDYVCSIWDREIDFIQVLNYRIYNCF